MSAQRASQLVEAGLWLRLSGDNEGARRLFEQALKLDPGNARARQLLESPAAGAKPLDAGAKATMEVDWGSATGKTKTPPPISPVKPAAQKTNTRPFGEGPPPGTHTVRLGEAAAPEIPDAPSFDDPHGEIQITGGDEDIPEDKSTLVFGMSGVPVPPSADPGLPGSGTLVFGSTKPEPFVPPAVKPVAGPGSETLVFGSQQDPAPPPQGAAPLSSGTLAFGRAELEQMGVVPPGSTGGTLAFGSAAPPPGEGQGFTSSREAPVVTEPGAPPFASPEDALPPARTPSTLEFNFDDMVAQANKLTPPPSGPTAPPSAPPMSSPSVPHDPPDDDGPKTAWDRSNPRIDISQIQPGEGGGLDLISAPPPPPKPRSPAQLKEEVSTLLSGAKDLLDLDDHSGAMELIGKALELDPTDASVLKLKDRSEKTLQAMYESKLGDLDRTPRVKLKDDEIIWLNLDHRAGFVLAQIDGNVSFEDLFAVSGMSRLDTARILAQLVEEGVISKG